MCVLFSPERASLGPLELHRIHQYSVNLGAFSSFIFEADIVRQRKNLPERLSFPVFSPELPSKKLSGTKRCDL